MSRRKRSLWQSAALNTSTYDYYYNFLKGITINRLKFNGLPDTVDERFIKRGLFERGSMLWFQDEEIGDVCLNYNLNGLLSIYDIPTVRNAYATNGQYFRDDLNENNSVIIWNNYSHLPDAPTAKLFALRLADIQRTIDVNIAGQKTPKIMTGNDSQRLAMKNLFMQWDGNEPFIFGDDSLLEQIKVEVLDTTAPYVADKLEIQKHMMINEYLSQVGISNSNNDKKERLVADEVNSNYGLVETSRNLSLNAIRQSLEEINKMFGHNITVEFQTDILPYEKEVEEIGTVYD